MQNINWEMMTQFIFPEELGIVEEVISVDIVPRWQQIESDESVRLVGIYHMTATARFNPKVLPQYSEGTLIEHLDFDGNDGYFEYALPLEVDLPREKVAVDYHPEMFVENVSFFVYDGSNCTFKWEVRCAFKEPIEGALFTYDAQPKTEQAIVKTAPELVQEPVVEAIEESLREPVQETIQEPIQEPLLVTTQEFEDEPILVMPLASVQEPVSETTQVSDQEPVSETMQESVQQPVLGTISEPLQELPIVAMENATYEPRESSSSSSSSSVHMAIDVNQGAVILDTENEENVVEVMNELEPVQSLESLTINKYFPTDTDDFFNDLTETYSLLHVSNKISRK